MNETPEVRCEEVYIRAPLPEAPTLGYEVRCGLPMKRVFRATDFIPCTGMHAWDSRKIKTASDVHGTGL